MTAPRLSKMQRLKDTIIALPPEELEDLVLWATGVRDVRREMAKPKKEETDGKH